VCTFQGLEFRRLRNGERPWLGLLWDNESVLADFRCSEDHLAP